MISVGDAVKFRTGVFGSRSKWREGIVEGIGPHDYTIAPLGGGAHVTITVGGENRSGAVRELRGARELPSPLLLSRATEPTAPQELRLVHCGPATLRAVPAPRALYRSGPYLAFVRARACCSCGLPGPSDPHHAGERGVGQKADDYSCVPLCRRCHVQVTDHYTLPGRDRAEVVLHFLRVQVTLLAEWAHDAEVLMADHVTVPILRRFAS